MSQRYPYVINMRVGKEHEDFLNLVSTETKQDKSEIVRMSIDILKTMVEMGITCRLVKCPHAGDVIVKKPM